MTYLITGAAGFIGARFVESCNQRGIRVISADYPDTFEKRPEHAGLDFGRKINWEGLLDFLSAEKPEIDAIIHMGACSDTTELDTAFLKRVNTDFTKALWNYCTENQIPFVYASSAATYGAGEYGYGDDESEMHRLKPLNPYGQSKLDFDLWALDEEKRGHHPPAWAGFKFFNVYGLGERHKGKMASVVLHAFDQIRKEGRVKLFKSHKEGIADGEQKRDFIYSDDVVDVLHFAAEKKDIRGIYNLGTGQARSFLDLTRAVFKSMSAPERIEFIPTPEALRERYQYFTEAEMKKLRDAGYAKEFTPLEAGVESYIKRLSRLS